MPPVSSRSGMNRCPKVRINAKNYWQQVKNWMSFRKKRFNLRQQVKAGVHNELQKCCLNVAKVVSYNEKNPYANFHISTQIYYANEKQSSKIFDILI